jgi:hypothetical protein
MKIKPTITKQTPSTTIQGYKVPAGTKITIGIKTGKKAGPHYGGTVTIP